MTPEKHRPLLAISERGRPDVQIQAVLALLFWRYLADDRAQRSHTARRLRTAGAVGQRIAHSAPRLRSLGRLEALAPACRGAVLNALKDKNGASDSASDLTCGGFDNDIHHRFFVLSLALA